MSIYLRTFLFTLAAACAANAIAWFALTRLRPPGAPPVHVSEIAEAIASRHGGPPPDGPGPRGGDGGPPLFGDRGPPPGERPGLRVRSADAPPGGSAIGGLVASPALHEAIARRLHADPGSVVAYQPAADAAHFATRFAADTSGDPLLAGRTLVAYRDDAGHWLILSQEEPPSGGWEGPWGLWLAIGEALVLAPLAGLFAYSLAAPLRRLGDAARVAADAGGSAPLVREGPPEVRAAADGFNVLQARLGRLVQERTHMVAAIAHDLRTPLARLAFRLDDLPPPLGDKARADIGEMTTMIAAALDFIRDRAVRGPFERLDLRSLVERVVEEHADLGHDVALETGAPLAIDGSPLELRRAVGNLVDNALKYGERARLRLAALADRCELQVDDDGPGIPEELQRQVFEPFYRIEGSRNRRSGGAGLGLATVRAIVLEHGGEITLANRKDGGLRATVRLPLRRR